MYLMKKIEAFFLKRFKDNIIVFFYKNVMPNPAYISKAQVI